MFTCCQLKCINHGNLDFFYFRSHGILMYGAEIWGWNEQEEVEKVQKKYLRGI
jgi:hypothetical protein